MYEVTFVNLLILIGMIPIGVFAAWAVLRWLDHLGGISFKADIVPALFATNGVGVYYGLRFVGVCYLIGQLASRFV